MDRDTLWSLTGWGWPTTSSSTMASIARWRFTGLTRPLRYVNGSVFLGRAWLEVMFPGRDDQVPQWRLHPVSEVHQTGQHGGVQQAAAEVQCRRGLSRVWRAVRVLSALLRGICGLSSQTQQTGKAGLVPVCADCAVSSTSYCRLQTSLSTGLVDFTTLRNPRPVDSVTSMTLYSPSWSSSSTTRESST